MTMLESRQGTGEEVFAGISDPLLAQTLLSFEPFLDQHAWPQRTTDVADVLPGMKEAFGMKSANSLREFMTGLRETGLLFSSDRDGRLSLDREDVQLIRAIHDTALRTPEFAAEVMLDTVGAVSTLGAQTIKRLGESELAKRLQENINNPGSDYYNGDMSRPTDYKRVRLSWGTSTYWKNQTRHLQELERMNTALHVADHVVEEDRIGLVKIANALNGELPPVIAETEALLQEFQADADGSSGESFTIFPDGDELPTGELPLREEELAFIDDPELLLSLVPLQKALDTSAPLPTKTAFIEGGLLSQIPESIGMSEAAFTDFFAGLREAGLIRSFESGGYPNMERVQVMLAGALKDTAWRMPTFSTLSFEEPRRAVEDLVVGTIERLGENPMAPVLTDNFLRGQPDVLRDERRAINYGKISSLWGESSYWVRRQAEVSIGPDGAEITGSDRLLPPRLYESFQVMQRYLETVPWTDESVAITELKSERLADAVGMSQRDFASFMADLLRTGIVTVSRGSDDKTLQYSRSSLLGLVPVAFVVGEEGITRKFGRLSPEEQFESVQKARDVWADMPGLESINDPKGLPAKNPPTPDVAEKGSNDGRLSDAVPIAILSREQPLRSSVVAIRKKPETKSYERVSATETDKGEVYKETNAIEAWKQRRYLTSELIAQLDPRQKSAYREFVAKQRYGLQSGPPEIPEVLIASLLGTYDVVKLTSLKEVMDKRSAASDVSFAEDVDLASAQGIRYVAWRLQNMAPSQFYRNTRSAPAALFYSDVRVALDGLVELQKEQPGAQFDSLYRKVRYPLKDKPEAAPQSSK